MTAVNLCSTCGQADHNGPCFPVSPRARETGRYHFGLDLTIGRETLVMLAELDDGTAYQYDPVVLER